MRKFDIQLKEGESVTDIQKRDNKIAVKTDKGDYEAKALIIASGKSSRELNVPGEKEFKHRGVTYCATCDGPLFAGKDVAIIGGGNSALDAAIQLIRIARRVYVINIASDFTGDPVMQEQVEDSKIATVIHNAQVRAILGDKFVTGIKIESQGKEQIIPVQGIFVEIGLIPNSAFAKEVEKNSFGEIKVNPLNQTNLAGVFAAGDVTDVPEKQIIIAAGEGAKAALSVFRYLAQHRL
jgi:alkyl hydroperoxide reductase subunit F